MLTGNTPDTLEAFSQPQDVVAVPTLADAIAHLQTQTFAGIYISTQDPTLWQQTKVLLQNEAILDVLGEGIAIIQPDLRILWANPTFEKWCGGPVLGRVFYEALGTPTVLGPDLNPFSSVLKGACVQTRLQRRDN